MAWTEPLWWWMAHSAVLSVVILTFGSMAIVMCRQPTRRLRIIELTLAGCLVAPLLGMIPGYPQLAIAWREAAVPEPEEVSTELPIGELVTTQPPIGEPVMAALPKSEAVPPLASGPTAEAVVEPAATAAQSWSVGSWLISLYLAGVVMGFAWWLVGMAALVRIISTARVAPPRCRQLLSEIAGGRSDRIRLLTSRLVKQPFASVGVAVQMGPQRAAWGRAVIVLPESLCDDEQAIRWALAHEWAHIEQGDFRVGVLAGLTRVLFFYQPLVWWLRRELRLCQDYVADARAACQASQPEDYAEFLVVRAAAGSLPPAMVGLGMGFSKGKSELYRRVVMLVQNRRLESRPPRLWTLSVTCAALLSVAVVGGVTISPQRAVGAGDDEKAEATAPSADASADQGKASPQADKPAEAKITLESLGFVTSQSDPERDEELDKLLKEKKYEFVKTFDSQNGEKRYAYQFIYPDGRRVSRNFSMPLDEVSSWDDYVKKQKLQREQRNERISQALTSGRFRLLDLEVMQMHICRDAESGSTFKVQRIQLPDHSEIASPRADFGKIPPSVQKTSWKEHLQAIRDGKRKLLKLETVNRYTYEMTADDGTKDIFRYGGTEPLEAICKRVSDPASSSRVLTIVTPSTPAKPGTPEPVKARVQVLGARPQGNCSLSGKLVSEATGEPIAGARMYLFSNATFSSIFINTDKDGAFAFNDIPTGPFSLRSTHKAGYQDAVYDPEGTPGHFPAFELGDGEQRSGIVLKAKEACRVAGEVRDENGNVPGNTRTMTVGAWLKTDDGVKYSQAQSMVKADGSYVIDGLGDTPVYVMARNWKNDMQGEGYPGIYAPSTFFRDEATLVTFDKSRSIEGVNITLRTSGGLILEGTVRDERGEPIPEAFVVAHHRDMLFDRVTAYSDAEGHYKLQGLGDGEVLVHVDAMHRGFVRTRVPVVLEKATPKVRRDFVLRRGASISGKFVDEDGKEWQIGRSYGVAKIKDPEQPEPESSWSGLPNKYGVQGVDGGSSLFYMPGEGDYDRCEIVFPTKSTFLFESVKPGYTIITFSPQKEGEEVVKILHNGQDIMESGIETKPGEEIKDVTIVIGKASSE